MDKASELVDTAGSEELNNGGPMTGGGGAVEAVWWADKKMTQWRLRGTAWLLGPDVDGPAGKMAREVISRKMRRREGDSGNPEDWSWAREVTGHFGNLSPAMRGTFRHPPPGTPVAIPPGEGLGLGLVVDDLDDPVARQNFRVVVVVPTEVDRVDLSDQKKPRRWLYTYRGTGTKSIQPGGEMTGEWEIVEVWP
jgi:hypothetical protein